MEHMKALDDELQINAAGGAEKGDAGKLSTVDRMELKLWLCPKCHISIKNIGIVHNREFEQGVLRVVFYDEPSMESAIKTLTWRNYKIYR